MRGHTLFRILALAAILACYVTILVGGNVIATGSGLGCSEWPACQGSQIIPPLTGAAAIEFSHRAAAFTLSMFVLALAITAYLWERRRPQIVRLTYAALATVGLEAILGGVVVKSDLTVGIVLAHFAIATVLFGLLLLIALLANVSELPPKWKRWARQAINGLPERDPYLPATDRRASDPSVDPAPSAGAASFDCPVDPALAWGRDAPRP